VCYLFFTSQIFRDFYWSHRQSFVENVLPEDKWEKEGLRIESSKFELENPDIVYSTDHGYIMYFSRHPTKDSLDIHAAVSSDGLNWKIIEEPIFKNAGGVAVVQLPDKRFRMYFQSLEAGESFKSAISEDGINFKIEEGIRFAAGKDTFSSVRIISHPTIIRDEKGYRLYFEDGLPHRNERKLKTTIINNTCELLYEENKEALSEIHYAHSEDGLNWMYGNKVIKFKQASLPYFIGGSSPTVVKVGGEYRMYFMPNRNKLTTSNEKDVTNCKIENIYDPFWLATSKDGVNFDIVKQTNVFGEDPDVVEADGKLRLYVWDHNRIYSYVQNIE
jgi:predicted GH43/DUF377 family glycosyl hydrolase